MNIIVLSLSLVSLASAAGILENAEREIIARQARKIQSQADEIKALKKANLRRRLMSSDDSEDDDSSGGYSLTNFKEEWEDFVDAMNQRKDDFAVASEEEEELDLEISGMPPLKSPPPPPPTKTLEGIDRCASRSNINAANLGPVPAFGRFVNAMQNKTKYPTDALDCMICSMSRIYNETLSDLIGSYDPDIDTYNPLVVMAPNEWVADEECKTLIDPSDDYCDGLTTCAMRLPTFDDLKITAAGDKNEANSMTKVYTAEAAMEYFELGLPVPSFNFIMSRFFERTDNEIVFDQEEWGAVRGSLDLTYTTHGADCGGGTDESSGGSNIAASENLQEIPSAAALAGPECSQRRRRRLQTQIPNGLS